MNSKRILTVLAVLVVGLVMTGCAGLHFGSGKVRPVTGSTWVLQDLNGRSPSSSITLQFSSMRSISGLSGCNTYGGNYTIGSLGYIKISAWTLGQRWCRPDSKMHQEKEFIRALRSAISHRHDDKRLELFGVDGRTLAVFSRN